MQFPIDQSIVDEFFDSPIMSIAQILKCGTKRRLSTEGRVSDVQFIFHVYTIFTHTYTAYIAIVFFTSEIIILRQLTSHCY